MKRLFLLLLLLAVGAGADETVKSGPWEYTFDTGNGSLTLLKWNGMTVSSNPARIPSFNWGPGWPGGEPVHRAGFFDSTSPGGKWFPKWDIFQKEAPYQLTGFDFDEKRSVLVKQYRIGAWRVAETVEFKARNLPDLLAVSLKMTYDGGDQPALLANVVFTLPIEKKGRIFFPATPRGDFAGRGPRDIAALPEKFGEEGWGPSVTPIVFEQSGFAALMLADPFKDYSNIQISVAGGEAQLRANFAAYGWAYPKEPQEIGPFYFRPYREKLETVFRQETQKLYKAFGWTVPADRPAWTRNAMMYSFYAGGSAQANSRNLGGFAAAAEEMIPRIAALGLNTAWMLPVQDGPFSYNPRFYRKVNAKLGTAEEFRSLVDAGHKNNLKMLLDIVPHGGTPAFGRDRGNKPWELTFDRDGNALSYWCFDYGVPSWRNYIRDVAAWQMKEYKLDGFRIDVPDGTHVANWSRRDFPAIDKVPKNVPEDWWQKELAANGGKLPPLPYERASIGRSGAGVEMIGAIRKGMKNAKPRESALLAEVQYALPYTVNADMIYDMHFCFSFCEKLLPALERPEFVRRLATWLEEQKYTEPAGVIRMRYVECHDSLPSIGFLGVGAKQAMFAVSFVIDGMPMVYQDSDIGNGVLIRKLTTLRRLLPELNTGEADYLAMNTVFGCLRYQEGKASLALVNLAPTAAEVKFQLPGARLPTGKLNVWDCRDGRKVAAGKSASELGELSVTLAPWEMTVLAVRPEAEALPVRLEPRWPAPQQGTGTAMTASQNDWGDVRVNAPAYSIFLNPNGELRYLRDAAGETLLDGSRFVFDTTISQAWPQLPSETKPVLEKTADGWRISYVTPLPTGGRARISYRCYPDRIELDATFEGEDSARSAAFVFAGSNVTRWQANTMEGLLDDLFLVRNRVGGANKNMERTSRLHGTPAQYQSRLSPLSPADAVIAALNNTGRGVALTLHDPLRAGVDDVMILDRIDRDERFHAAFFWKNPEMHFPLTPHDRRFTLTIAPQSAPLPPTVQNNTCRNGGVTLENGSVGWTVANRFYKADIRRTGGVLSSLRAADGRELLRGNDIVADGGFVPEKEKGKYALSNDIDTGVSLRSENGKTVLLFTGAIRMAAVSGNRNPPLHGAIRYTFDESPKIGVEYFFMNEIPPAFGAPDVSVRQVPGDSLKFFDTPEFKPWKQYRIATEIDTSGK